MTFEESLNKLIKIKEDLENPNITLDEALNLYKDSSVYAKNCLELLKSTDEKIVAIKSELDTLVEKPLDENEE